MRNSSKHTPESELQATPPEAASAAISVHRVPAYASELQDVLSSAPKTYSSKEVFGFYRDIETVLHHCFLMQLEEGWQAWDGPEGAFVDIEKAAKYLRKASYELWNHACWLKRFEDDEKKRAAAERRRRLKKQECASNVVPFQPTAHDEQIFPPAG